MYILSIEGNELHEYVRGYISRTETRSVRMIRDSVATVACRLFGREGRDWRMVQDTTAIGFHARATNGDVVVIR